MRKDIMKGGFAILQNAAVRAWLLLTSYMFIVVCVCREFISDED